MKTYDEIARRVLSRRDEYKEKQKIKRQSATQIATTIVCLVVVTVTYLTAVRRNWLKIQFEELMAFQSAITATNRLPTNSDNTTKVPADKQTTLPTAYTTLPFLSTTEISVEDDWNEKSMPGRFSTLAIKGTQHLSAIDESDIVGGCVERVYTYPFESSSETATTRPATLLLTDKYMAGREPNWTLHTTLVDVFSLEGISEDLALGVRFPDDERIYTYVYTCYMPETLGEFLEAVDYDNTVTYGGIRLYPGNNFPVNAENANDIKKYLLSDVSIRNLIDADAEAIGQCVTVTINCHELGRTGKTLNVYEDGHITTNLIGYEYTFYVGEEAVAAFLKNSYNITFEEINAQTSNSEMQTMTTSPTTEPTTFTAATVINETQATETTASDTEKIEAVTAEAETTVDPSYQCSTETE